MNLSRRIRDLRYAKGWGPDELASRAKISRTALYQIERGNTSKPQAGTLRRISRALGVPLEILLETPFVSTDSDSEALPNAVAPTPASGVVRRAGYFIRSGGGIVGEISADPGSPLAEGVARIVEESFRLLPIIPPPSSSEPSRYAPPIDLKPARQNRGRSPSTV